MKRTSIMKKLLFLFLALIVLAPAEFILAGIAGSILLCVTDRDHWELDNGLIEREGDALAVSAGRTEDVLFAIQYRLNNNVALKLGYRIFEGGIDDDEIYNFKLLNYVVIGPVLTF